MAYKAAMALWLHPRPTRRQFLAAAGTAAASVTFARAATSSQAPARPLRLALLSDTHIPANPAERYRGFAPVDNLAKVVPQVVATPVDGALIGGDLARLQGLPEDYERLRELLAPIVDKVPTGLVLGNHDHRTNFRQAFPAAAGTQPPLANKHTSTREAGGLRFVLLDSLLAPDVTPGQLGSAQRAWLGEQLTTTPTPTIILVHHTLGGNDGELVDAERLFELLRPHRHVKAIMFGHSHKYEVTERDGLQLINLPAVGYNFVDTEPVGWVDSLWTDEGVDLTLRSIGGNQTANGQTTSVHWAR
jgi:3',5'-cyclic-AMP phosphodiesterase